MCNAAEDIGKQCQQNPALCWFNLNTAAADLTNEMQISGRRYAGV